MNEIELLTIQLRLEGVRQAITRSRFTLLVAIIASVAIIITAWNSYLSWDTGFARLPHWSHDKSFTPEQREKRITNDPEKADIKPEKITEVTDFAQQQLISEWVKNHIISVGLLGIRVSVNDLPVLGGLSLFIISVWFFFAVRRENRAIGTLLRDAYRLKDRNARYMVYQGIVHHLVLIDIGRGDEPIEDFEKEESDEIHNIPFVRKALKVIFYLPPLSIFFVILMDILTLFLLPAPFRPSHEPLRHVLDTYDWIEVGVMESLAFILMIMTFILCRRVMRFIEATGRLLSKYRLKLKESLSEDRIND